MQLGKHYSIRVLGEEYIAVCIGSDDKACYLKTATGETLVVSFYDELAFSTVAETMREKEALDKIFNETEGKDLDMMIQEDFEKGKLVMSDVPIINLTPLDTIRNTIQYLQKKEQELQACENYLQSQGLGYTANYPSLESLQRKQEEQQTHVMTR